LGRIPKKKSHGAGQPEGIKTTAATKETSIKQEFEMHEGKTQVQREEKAKKVISWGTKFEPNQALCLRKKKEGTRRRV